jgi:hypothetical protein
MGKSLDLPLGEIAKANQAYEGKGWSQVEAPQHRAHVFTDGQMNPHKLD